MTDLFSPDVVQHAPVVKHVAKHAVHHAPQIINQGISMLSLVISNVLTAIVSVSASWYISHRGLQGVKNDIANAKAAIEKLTSAPVA